MRMMVRYHSMNLKDFFKLLNLEDLEEVYSLIPKKDLVALRRVESLILKTTLRKRRDLKLKHGM